MKSDILIRILSNLIFLKQKILKFELKKCFSGKYLLNLDDK